MKKSDLYKEIDGIKNKFCKKCEIYHPFNNVFWYFKSKGVACKAKVKVYSSQPHVLERRRADNISPENLLRRRISQKRARSKLTAEKRLAYNRKYTAKPETKEKRRGYAKKESYKKYKCDWMKRKFREDPVFRAKCNIRHRINCAAQKISGRKAYISEIRSLELFGCSLDDLKNHLSSKFRDGMSWENYGTWEIDHIIPMAEFNIMSVDDMKKCNHFSNLQPLWKSENASKGARLLEGCEPMSISA